jgi:hypothetical protein
VGLLETKEKAFVKAINNASMENFGKAYFELSEKEFGILEDMMEVAAKIEGDEMVAVTRRMAELGIDGKDILDDPKLILKVTESFEEISDIANVNSAFDKDIAKAQKNPAPLILDLIPFIENEEELKKIQSAISKRLVALKLGAGAKEYRKVA